MTKKNFFGRTIISIVGASLIGGMFAGCGTTDVSQTTEGIETEYTEENNVTVVETDSIEDGVFTYTIDTSYLDDMSYLDEIESYSTLHNNGSIPIAETSIDFAESLELGWNIGNTLEATDGIKLAAETSWGNPKVTKELIHYVKECGFTSVRIPISYSKHIELSNFEIDEKWLDRVEEVVNYCLEEDLYVIINSHHDCVIYKPTMDNMERASVYLSTIWQQVAERFASYDERVIFESMNEPRMIDMDKEWWFAADDEEGNESIECIVMLNQIFVDTVRSSGGYNRIRYLLVPSYAASADYALLDTFVMPEDPENKTMVSVHAYTPYDFALNTAGYSTWTEEKESELVFLDNLAAKFIDNGYGVVIGEFGALDKNNLDDRVAWAIAYTSKTKELGMSAFWWDNNAIGTDGENFGLINRNDLTLYYPEILDAMLEVYNSESAE